MDESRPLVSIVIPVRNDAVRLRQCLTSVLSGHYPRERVQIIVVDNSSTDGSASVAEEAGARVLHGKDGDSVAALRNQGAAEAAGEIVAFVDADHRLDPDWLGTAVDVLSESRIGAAGSAYSLPPSTTWVQRQYDSLRRHPRRREDVTWLGSGSLAMPAAVFRSIGGFNARLTACEDVDLCNRLRLAGHRIVADPGLRSVHYGDPSTLKALFFGELWRGRDNVRVTLAGPWTLRDLRSAVVPVLTLICFVVIVVGALAGNTLVALGSGVVAILPTLLRTVSMVRRQSLAGGLSVVAQALAFAAVFDAARALALVSRGSHRRRRVAQ